MVRRTNDERTDQINRLRQICETAQQLRNLLKQDDESDWRVQLEDLIRRKESELEDPELELKLSRPGRELEVAYRRQSGFDLLVGVLLPRIFERHFGVKPTFYLGSAYVRFAEAVLKVSNIKDGDETYNRSSIKTSFFRATKQPQPAVEGRR